jgi:hypothetical protein
VQLYLASRDLSQRLGEILGRDNGNHAGATEKVAG